MITLCPALREKISGEDAFEQVFAMEGKIYRNFKGRKTLRFEHAGKGYFLKIHPGVGWGEIFKTLMSLRHSDMPLLFGKATIKWFSTATGWSPLIKVAAARCRSAGLEVRRIATKGGITILPENFLKSLK